MTSWPRQFVPRPSSKLTLTAGGSRSIPRPAFSPAGPLELSSSRASVSSSIAHAEAVISADHLQRGAGFSRAWWCSLRVGGSSAIGQSPPKSTRRHINTMSVNGTVAAAAADNASSGPAGDGGPVEPTTTECGAEDDTGISGAVTGAKSTSKAEVQLQQGSEPEPNPPPPLTTEQFRVYNRLAETMEYFV